MLSVDVPSGIDASTGEIAGAAVRASVTVTFHGAKVGLVVSPGRLNAGRVVVADIGLDPQPTATVRATPAVLGLVPRRGAGDTKFTAGALLVVGGAPGTIGAAVLTATAALRADAGYVTLAVPEPLLATAEALALEPVKRGFDFATALDALAPDIERARAIAVGPGLGRSPEARFARTCVARALRPAGSRRRRRAARARARHARRAARPHTARGRARAAPRHRGGLGLRASARGRRPVRRAIRRRGGAEGRRHDRPGAGGRTIVSDTGPPSLATAGTGDVLTGVIGAFLAKGLDAVDAAVAGAVAHGLAARSVPHQAGLDRVRCRRSVARRSSELTRMATVRSRITIDLGAIRHNAGCWPISSRAPSSGPSSRRTATGTERWTSEEPRSTAALRRSASRRSRGASASHRAPWREDRRARADGAQDVPVARDAALELTVPDGRLPEGVPVHLKLDTGMGRWGLSELPVPGPSSSAS